LSSNKFGEKMSSNNYSHPFLKRKLGHWIGGEVVPSASGKTFATENPSTGEILTYLAEGDEQDVDRAVVAARKAFKGPWAAWTPFERQQLLMRLYDLVDTKFEEMAALETLDIGSPISRSRSLKKNALQGIAYAIGQTREGAGSTLSNSLPGDVKTMTIKAPLGVVGGIMPWNNPLVGQWFLVGGAIASGCTLVLKPAELASLSVLYMIDLLHEAGLPAGVVNAVTGRGSIAGAALAEHEDVDRIVFTGSVEAGRSVIRASASNLKRVQLETGGKSPNIIFNDANLTRAVPASAMAVFNNSGQICTAGSRLLVQNDVYDEVVAGLGEFANSLKVGNGMEPDVQMGPLISENQLERVMSYVETAEPEGARLVAGGSRLQGELSNGYFVPPTVFADASPEMTIAREEIFGPVLTVLPFSTEEEALEIANATPYGLGGAVWTSDASTAMRMLHGIEAGNVWVNNYGLMDYGVGQAGYKLSGYGTKGGPAYSEMFLYEKTVYFDLG
jgi:aldehyde dehydrogenase (NAD+)